MKKKLLFSILILGLFIQASPFSMAQNRYLTNSVSIAIKKYKTHNYTGCLQDCLDIVQRDPSNPLAYYYLAMSYAQAGKKNEAIQAYSVVLALQPKAKLLEYASTGKRCLETPSMCHPPAPKPAKKTTTATPKDGSATNGSAPNKPIGGNDELSDLDKFIASPSNTLSPTVKQQVERKQLDAMKNNMNSGKIIDPSKLNLLNENKPEIKTESVAENKTPSNDDIVAALKVLKAAGLDPYSANQLQSANIVNPYADMPGSQNAEMQQLNMLMGGSSQNQNNNAMMNMLPFMLAQNKNGTNNYSPQLMQAVIMNSMMSDVNFNVDRNNNNN